MAPEISHIAGCPNRLELQPRAKDSIQSMDATDFDWPNAISEIWRLEARIVMNATFVLLAGSAILGFVLGFYFSWFAILVWGAVLALVSATVLQKEGFDFLPGIAIIVACLTVTQVAYLIGVKLRSRGWQDK